MDGAGVGQVTKVLRCPLCGSRERATVYGDIPDFKYGVPGSWSFVRCARCGLVYLDPRLADPMRGYPATYSQHVPSRAPQVGAIGAFKAGVRQGILWNCGYRAATHRRWVIVVGKICKLIPSIKRRALFDFLLFPRAVEGGRLLDIGCGNGRFLAVMKMLGWEVYGIEPDQSSARLARDLTGALIYRTLQEADFPSDFFDIITMNHVFEHIENPLWLLMECYRILRAKGKLGICVPNWKSLSHRFFRQHCYHLEPPRHVAMYEPRVLAMACRQVGFALESVTTTSVREAKVSFKKSWHHMKGTPPGPMLVRMWSLFAWLMSFFARESGEEIVLWAAKEQ